MQITFDEKGNEKVQIYEKDVKIEKVNFYKQNKTKEKKKNSDISEKQS